MQPAVSARFVQPIDSHVVSFHYPRELPIILNSQRHIHGYPRVYQYTSKRHPREPRISNLDTMAETTEKAPVHLPRVAITYCTQCRWMLRAAYFGQELLSTFGTAIGEIALIPATGGLFTVHLTYKPAEEGESAQAQEVLIWDRKAEGGFPETKILKQRVRNHIEPGKDLGHSDKPANKPKGESAGQQRDQKEGQASEKPSSESAPADKDCADCK